MSLPNDLKITLSPQEVEFLTESEMITILPRYSMNKLELITDDIPKLMAMHRIQVPLWYALILKQQRKCSIVPPNWLNHKSLKEFFQSEVTELNQFSKLPHNWLELSKIFFENAADDLSDEPAKLKSLIQDLKELRLIKVKKGLSLINESHLQLDNLSILEINEIRPFVVEVMGKLTKLKQVITNEIDEDRLEDRDNDDDLME
ncbi:hypothetical protein WICMUC_002096 [Wickerhamomyces mucosus]|uniref:DNA replication complex GINS protein PSF2 n=1 Tax=Wickerhamomyces mucosus TaxID=1378264 RepID=A0A9P8PRF9_9ASCO|nr:hypothetical protein WICMUC_002096 [Wickerhamomyces mucosus]